MSDTPWTNWHLTRDHGGFQGPFVTVGVHLDDLAAAPRNIPQFNKMKILASIAALLLFGHPAFAQPPDWWIALHGSYLTADELAQVTLPPIAGLEIPPNGDTPSCVKPSSFYAVGASLNKAARPNVAGLFLVAVPLTCDVKSFQVYSFTEHNIIPVGHGKTLSFKEATTTGFATPLKKIGPFETFVFGQIGFSLGTAPSPGSGAQLASAYGVAAAFPPWKGSAWRGLIAAQKVDGDNIFSVLVGRSWK